MKRVAVPGPDGPIPIEPAHTFHPGSRYRDVDVVAYLDQNCSSWMAHSERRKGVLVRSGVQTIRRSTLFTRPCSFGIFPTI